MADWEDLRHFAALAEAGSLSGAARLIGVEHATIARRGENYHDVPNMFESFVDREIYPRAVLQTDPGAPAPRPFETAGFRPPPRGEEIQRGLMVRRPRQRPSNHGLLRCIRASR